jgi:hypothetical protein
MFRKFLPGLAPVLAVAALVAIPTEAQAIVPRVFSNGVKLGTTHVNAFAFGRITLRSGYLENLECENFSAGQTWNEVVNGTERGFLQTTGYGTWDCAASNPVNIKNTKGERVPGIFLTAEGEPVMHSEKAYKTGNTSLPWRGELTEKEGRNFVLTHNVKVWIVTPLCTEEGGTGEGGGCNLQGSEIPIEDREGAAEKANGDEVAFKCVNGARNGLSPFKAVLEGEKEGTEKGKPETGRLESGFGPGYLTGSLVFAGGGFGGDHFELIACKHPYFGR